jgi:hypothetical protein
MSERIELHRIERDGFGSMINPASRIPAVENLTSCTRKLLSGR